MGGKSNYYRAMDEYKSKRYKGVIEKINLYLQEDKRNGIDAKGLFVLAKSYNILKMKKESMKIFDIVLRLDPKNVHARLELGKLYASQGKEAEAEELFKEYMELDPKNVHATLELKKLYIKQGREEETDKIAVYASQDEELEELFKKSIDNPKTALERARKLIYDSEDIFEASEEIISIINEEESDSTIKTLLEAEIATKIGLK